MADIYAIMLMMNIIILLIFNIFTLIHLLPILVIRRFQTTPNILIGNFCLCSFLCASFWTTYYIIIRLYPTILGTSIYLRIIIPYCQVFFNYLLVYSLVMITINRFFIIMYPNKQLFKKQTWSFISILTHWIIAFILAIPQFILSIQMFTNTITTPFWLVVYHLFIVVILPSILNGLFNTLIFFKVRSSSRRVHVETSTKSNVANSNHQNTHRDIHLLKHMLFLFIIFIIGWGPTYTLVVVDWYGRAPLWIYLFLRALPAFCFLINIIDLFLYNHDLRQYLQKKLLDCFLLNRN